MLVPFRPHLWRLYAVWLGAYMLRAQAVATAVVGALGWVQLAPPGPGPGHYFIPCPPALCLLPSEWEVSKRCDFPGLRACLAELYVVFRRGDFGWSARGWLDWPLMLDSSRV